MRVYHLNDRYNRVYQIILSLVLTFPVYADIVTDGTVGNAQALTGPNFTIPENLGSRAGANLFHSFQRFNIFQGESATFTGSNSIANVISRVTGGQASTINGLLRSTVGQADFYFINPAGVMFGANAQIDVPASFYVSTANELRFPDGEVFSATNPAASTLSIDQPQSFGFLGDQTAKISVVGSTLFLNPRTFSVSGGNLEIDSAIINAGIGEIELVATGSTATKVMVGGDLQQSVNGKLSIINSNIDASGDGTGRIVIRAGQSNMNSSFLSADNTSFFNDAGFDKGIDIQAGSLDIISSQVKTETLGSRAAGNLLVNINDKLSLVNGGLIGSDSLTGNAGDIRVNAGHLEIDSMGSVSSTGISSSSFSSGNLGTVDVTVYGDLSIMNGGAIGINAFGTGDSGNLKVTADNLTIDKQGSDLFTGISSFPNPAFGGGAGPVTVNVKNHLTLLSGGAISSSTFLSGNGGNITVNAGSILIDDLGQNLVTGISSDTVSSGNAGTIEVKVNNLSLVNGGQISANTSAAGAAGNLNVEAGKILIDNNNSLVLTGISSLAKEGSFGQAGNVSIKTQHLSLTDDGRIAINTFPTISAATLANIQPTQINITAKNITLTNSSITTESSGNVPAGSITLNVGDTLSLDPSSISTAANNADGGAISIRAKVIDLQDSQITTSVSGQGDGGNINLDTDVLVLDSGFIQANTSGVNAKGGDIRIDTNALVANNNNLLTGGDTPLSFQPGLNVIQAAAPDGVSGNIDITSPQLDISGDLIDLDATLLNVDDLAQNPCATTGGKQSTLVSLGRGGLPESPEQAGSIIITPERLQWLLPRPDTLTDPESESLHPETTRHKQSKIESKTWLAWLESDC